MKAPRTMLARTTAALGVVAVCAGTVAFASTTAAAGSADRGPTTVAVTDLTNGETPDQLAQSLVGSGVTISNVTYTGAPRGAGEFTNGAAGIGLDSGVVLSTGKVKTESPGGPDLNALVAPATTHDAAVLQFDFVPKDPVIQIPYVFGPDEDRDSDSGPGGVFGLFVNGQNCALGPGTSTPVSNEGQSAGGKTVHTCVAQVKAGEENHMKLAIADTGDKREDWAVFIGTASFRSGITSGLATTFTGTAPDAISGPLATFTDPNQNATPGSYTSTIDWGDGTASAGTITGSDGSFVVSGDHTYPTAGSYTIKVTTTAAANATNTTSTTDQATIRSKISTASGASPIAGSAPTTISGPVAQFTVVDPTATAASYAATIDWGDGTTSPGAVSGSDGKFTVSGDHTYRTPGSYPITVKISDRHDAQNTASASNTADITQVCPGSTPDSAPLLGQETPAQLTTSSAAVDSAVSTCGLPTTVYLQYGLDNRYRLNPAPGITYDQQTASQTLPASTSPTTVSLTASGLVPNALYHARLVATNAAGTTDGPDQTFTTLQDGTPGAPVLAKSFDGSAASGLILIKLPANGSAKARGGRRVRVLLPRTNGFFPLTEALSLPVGTRIDARRGSLTLRMAGAHKDTQTGVFTSGLFSVRQAGKGSSAGVTTISLVEGAFPGAPTYAGCKAQHRSRDLWASMARLSANVLQTLRARAHGNFRTVGRYSAGTVRGTEWTTIDRCDGTLTIVYVHTVEVYDFTRHVTVPVHAGHSYLAPARPVPHPTPPAPGPR